MMIPSRQHRQQRHNPTLEGQVIVATQVLQRAAHLPLPRLLPLSLNPSYRYGCCTLHPARRPPNPRTWYCFFAFACMTRMLAAPEAAVTWDLTPCPLARIHSIAEPSPLPAYMRPRRS
jgi:hypothetical protein